MLLTVKAFVMLTPSSVIRDRWLTSESLLRLITQHYSFNDIGGLTEKQLNKALEKGFSHLDAKEPDLNDTSYFRVSHHIMSPYALKDKPVMTRFYYITNSNKEMPQIPSSNATDEWTRLFIEAKAN
jgi:hypothetical protein